ncbi:MAG TPA: DJ-1/PfpI family protein [Acidobacteriota bacterium]|nr:DJ-1/PfpI family protein [Acidobacteriota bacterium]
MGIIAAVLTVGFGFRGTEEEKEQDDVVYVCPPCGIHCDHLHHKEPGQCPVCGMNLIDKRDLLQAAVLLSPRVPMTQVAGPAQVFLASRGFFTYTVGAGDTRESQGALYSRELFQVKARHSISDAPLPQVLVVAGGDMDILEDEAAMSWVRKAGEEAEAVLGIGTGVAILAKAGLLEGREAALDENLSRLIEYFQLKEAAHYRHDKPWVESGKFITATSADSALDASLILVGNLLGPSQARQAAQSLGRSMPEKQ